MPRATSTTPNAVAIYRGLKRQGYRSAELRSLFFVKMRSILSRETLHQNLVPAVTARSVYFCTPRQKQLFRDTGRLISECIRSRNPDKIIEAINQRNDRGNYIVAGELRNRVFQILQGENMPVRVSRCDHCGDSARLDRIVRSDCGSICPRCQSAATRCARCEQLSITPQAIVAADGTTNVNWCRQCSERAHYWERDGRYHVVPQPVSGVGCYHSSRNYLRRIGNKIQDLPDVGFELEWVPMSRNMVARDEITDKLRQLDHIVAGVEQDGSVSGECGAEIVTHYGAIDEVIKGGYDITGVLSGKAKSHSTNCCGLHVSLGREGIDQMSLAKYIVFWNNPKNRAFLKAFARRWESGYCRPKTEKSVLPKNPSEMSNFEYNQDRYELVNVQNSNRVEVRAFRGTTNGATLDRCVALSAWLMAYVQSGTSVDLNFPSFLKWCETASVRGNAKLTPEKVVEFAVAKGFAQCV